MLRRRGVLLTGCSGVVLAAAVLIYWSLREPRYDGRSLSHWLARLVVHTWREWPPVPNAAERTRAQEAIGHIGTNALPYLMRWIEYRPTFDNEFFRWLRARRPRFVPPSSVSDGELRAREAAEAFRYITNPPPATLRELARLAQDQDRTIKERARIAISNLGEHSAVALTVLMTNDAPGLRHYAIQRLSQVFSPQLKDPYGAVRIEATNALQRIAPETLGNWTVQE